MTRRTKSLLTAAVGLAGLAGGAAIAGASGEDHGRPIVGSALDRASAAALHEVAGGRVTATEAGDEEGAYEIEVTRDDGSAVDVHLDSSFAVIDVSPDGPADHADSHGS